MSARWSSVSKFGFMATISIVMGVPWPLAAQVQQDQQPPQQQQPQPPPPQQQPQPQQQQSLTQQQLQQLVAPIALYPDALLAQILTASTYPLEVAMAARWSEKNSGLKGAALEDAMQKQPWDTSVKGLTSVPQVLVMMNEKLDWTNQLGEAFLAQPDDVQTAIQALRKQADATGNLKSSKEQKVRRVAAPPSTGYVGPPEYIVIEPVEPDYVYIPVYDPVVVYGPSYWSPAYVPFFWHPPWWAVGPAFGFGAAVFVGPALWYHYNWGHSGFAAIQTNTVLYSKFNKVNVSGGQFQNWKFDPAHHGGVQFKNTKLQQQFGNLGGENLQGIQTGKTIQGIQGVQTGKNIQGIQTGKSIQGVQTGKGVQGIQTSKRIEGVQTGKNLQTGQSLNKGKSSKMVSSQAIQGGQAGKATGKRVQGGDKIKKKGPH
jgi:Protein of unknown function (DUF3300)